MVSAQKRSGLLLKPMQRPVDILSGATDEVTAVTVTAGTATKFGIVVKTYCPLSG